VAASSKSHPDAGTYDKNYRVSPTIPVVIVFIALWRLPKNRFAQPL
jgi:hypothetical protein